MKMFNNTGQLVSEINVVVGSDGSRVTTQTVYDTHVGRVASQNISAKDAHGNVRTINLLNGKLLP